MEEKAKHYAEAGAQKAVVSQKSGIFAHGKNK